MVISYTTVQSDADLNDILNLQKKNLPKNLDTTAREEQGFVTVDHSFEVLESLNQHEAHIVAKIDNQVIGYVLTMTQKSRNDIPILFPMFAMFDETAFEGKPISEYKYMLVGQVCVAKEYRGRGIFSSLYELYKKHYSSQYDFAITEVATTNQRSLRAHEKIGFEPIFTYADPYGTEWAVIVWKWK